jgi:hypothetical protein
VERAEAAITPTEAAAARQAGSAASIEDVVARFL